ncbi:AraC family transcriptional regulator [Hydrogenophaga sp. 5NK40-0174]
MGFARAIVLAYQSRQMDPVHALAAAGLTLNGLNAADANARMTAHQMEALSDAAMRELDDEALGWFERPLPWGSYGMLARASLSSPTLGLAIQRWCRHHALLARGVTLFLHTRGELATIELVEHRPPGTGGQLREFCHVSLLRNVLGLSCWYVDSRIPLRGAQMAFSPPSHADAYSVLFDGPTQFDAAHSAVSFDAAYLALPLRRDEAAMRHMLQRALPLTVHLYRRDRLLVQRVRSALRDRPALTHNADDTATLLGISVRTLHRQLKDEGASLQGLKDEVRRQRAMELLQRTQRPIKQVAQAVGFQNEKSFSRAFKAWTGKTPGEWRG